MYVISTRDAKNMIPATMAVLKGIAGDGGLYVPEYFPKLDMAEVIETANSSYSELSALILSTFFEMGRDDLNALTKAAYASFDAPETVPVKRLSGSEYVLELFHGPTLAFKDMALQVLPRLISEALEIHEQGNGVLILTATSGDTGKAALEGFKDVPRTAILVFYPASGVSPMQKLQMVTQEGSNTGVCAVEGNFDDAQTGVKQLFANAGFVAEAGRKNYELSSANSINIGRLAPQVAYYAYAYAKLVNDDVIDEGDSVNFCVPTGNFGNILAAYYACRMGVPVNKLICASNRNNILTDFFHSGNYDTNREFHKTMSPSMDILISSNLERLLFEICGRDSEAVKRLMDALAGKGAYSLPEDARRELSGLFYAGFCNEEETAATIKNVYETNGYLMDTHTAVAQRVYEKYIEETGDKTVTVVASTAHPFKFTQDVLKAITGIYEDDAFTAAERLSEICSLPVPNQINELKHKKVRHGGIVAKDGLIGAAREFLNQH